MTDNSRIDEKLTLRRSFLDEFHKGQSFKVFDACAGDKRMWTVLEAEYPCNYWGVDLKPSKTNPSRLQVDSRRILQQPGWDFDVIDVDVYGSPWVHWHAILRNSKKPVTVFLTLGDVGITGAFGNAETKILGLERINDHMPSGFKSHLMKLATEYHLAALFDYGWQAQRVATTRAKLNQVKYFGVRLVRASSPKQPEEVATS